MPTTPVPFCRWAAVAAHLTIATEACNSTDGHKEPRAPPAQVADTQTPSRRNKQFPFLFILYLQAAPNNDKTNKKAANCTAKA